MNTLRVDVAVGDDGDPAVVRLPGIKPSNLPDAIITIVPTRPDGSRDWQRQGWRAIAVSRRRCVVFGRRLKATELTDMYLHPSDPVCQLLNRAVEPTMISVKRLIWLIGRLDIPAEYQDEVRSLMKAEGEDRPVQPTRAGTSMQARRKLLTLNRSAGQFRNRLRRLQQFVEPLAAKDRRHLRPVFLTMNLVVDHVELLMEMHAGLPRIASTAVPRRSTLHQVD